MKSKSRDAHGVIAFLIATIVSMPGAAARSQTPPTEEALRREAAISRLALDGVRTVPVGEQALRATNALGYFELANPQEEGVALNVEEVRRVSLHPTPEMQETGLAQFFSGVFVGRVVGEPDYVVAVVGDLGSGGDEIARAFLAFARADSEPAAMAVAERFADLFNGVLGGSASLLEEPILLCPCEDCQIVLNQEMNSCALVANLCIAGATAAGVACAIACLGLPPCLVACAIATVVAVTACSISQAACDRAAVREFLDCEMTCNP